MKYKYDLEDRLIRFSVRTVKMTRELDQTYASKHLASQIIRSSTSTALNYGEAQAAESQKDFIHKMKLVLKELRESHVCLKILRDLSERDSLFNELIKEANELISIFVKSISTAKKNLK